MATRQYIGPVKSHGTRIEHCWTKYPVNGSYLYVRIWVLHPSASSIDPGPNWHRINDTWGAFKYRKVANDEGLGLTSCINGGIGFIDDNSCWHSLRMWEVTV